MTAADACKCARLLRRAHELIGDALWTHIYDEESGDKPDANCEYSQWLRDVEEFLLPVEVT